MIKENTVDNGWITTCMVMGFIPGQMDENTKETIFAIKNTAMESTQPRTTQNTRANEKKVFNMGKAL